ncbi:MAG: Succinate-semialdehyde dehydrogenase [Gemmatimonadetes bacterium]|nr:Succinate-semialdehyde dehydrogenase [Gemmatimonadota bacterium]
MSAPQARLVESRDPSTGEVWRRFDACDAAAVARALQQARDAQPAWAGAPIADRARVLERFRKLLFARRHEAAELVSRENGKPPIEAMGEVMLVMDFARFYSSGKALRALRPQRFTPQSMAMWRKRIEILHEPLGVVGVIAPWNYPLMLPAGIVIPALVAGNAVLLKPSEFTPSSALLLGELLGEAGVPPGVLAVLPGAGETGRAITTCGVDKLFFTGSEATGRAVAIACAEQLVPCSLELGGSDPAIVLASADVNIAADGILWGRCFNAGQTCVAAKRVFVEAPAYDAFLLAIATRVKELSVSLDRGSAEVGTLIRPQQREMLQAQLDDALAHGARVVASASGPAGVFAPTILADLSDEMRVMREETFGPLLPVIRVRDANEAVRLANASTYGLSASVWGDEPQASRVARRLDAGTVVINDALVAAGLAEVPHGGVKRSGSGRSHGIAGLLECVKTRTLVHETLPGKPQVWWFPYGGALAAGMDAFLSMAHGSGGARLRGLLGARALVSRLKSRRR